MLEKFSSSRRFGIAQTLGWLQANLGEPPGAYFLALLWLEIASLAALLLILPSLSFANAFSTILRVFGDYTGAGFIPPSDGLITNFILPLALVTLTLHWITTRSQPLSRLRQAALVGAAAAAAIGVYLLPYKLPVPAQLMLLFILTISRRHRLSTPWPMLIVGLLFGYGCMLLLGSPVQTLVYDRVVPGFETAATGLEFQLTLALNGFLSVLLGLAAGPVAVLWSRPQSRLGRLAIGAGTGMVVGALVFGGVGAPAAGIIAQSNLYGVALSREGYGPTEGLLKLAIAVNNTFPWTYGAFWLLAGGMALIGGVTGLLTPFAVSLSNRERSTPASSVKTASQVWLLPAFLVAFIALLFVTFINLVILELLGPALQNVFDQLGATPLWQPEWVKLAAAGQPALAMIIVQSLGLWRLYRLRARGELSNAAALVALIGGIFGLGSSGLFYLLSSRSPFTILIMLVTAALSLEMAILGWQGWLRQRANGSKLEEEAQPSPNLLDWMAGGAAGGLLAAIFGQQLVSASLNLVLVAIVIIVQLFAAGPPPGLSWLQETLSPLFVVAPVASVWLSITWTTAMGLVVGGSLGLLNYSWQNKTRPIVGATLPQEVTPSAVVPPPAAAHQPVVVHPTGVTLAVALAGAALAAMVAPSPNLFSSNWVNDILDALFAGAAGAWLSVFLLRALQTGAVLRSAPPASAWPRVLVLAVISIIAAAVVLHVVWLSDLLGNSVWPFGLVGAGLLLPALFTRFILRRRGVERIPLPILAAAIGVGFAGLIGLELLKLEQFSLASPWGWIVFLLYALLVSPAVVIGYQGLIATVPLVSRPRVRLIMLGSLVLAILAFPIFTFAFTFWVVRRYRVERLHPLAWAAAPPVFASVGLTFLLALHHNQIISPWAPLVFALIIGPAAAITYQAIVACTPVKSRLPLVRLGTLLGLAVVVSLSIYSSQERVNITGGVTRYDGQHWETFAGETVAPSGRLNYQLFTDRLGQLWYGGGGLVARWVGEQWKAYSFSSLFSGISAADITLGDRARLYNQRTWFTEDNQGRLWIAWGDKFGQFAPEISTTTPLRTPGMLLNESEAAAADPGVVCVEAISLWNNSAEMFKPTLIGSGTLLGFSPDGTLILTRSNDGTVSVWDRRGYFLRSVGGHRNGTKTAEFSPDGKQLVTTGDDFFTRIWDATTGELLLTLEPGSPRSSTLTFAHFSPDGRRLVTASEDKTAQVWNAATGELLLTLRDHTAKVNSARFSPDGNWIVTAGADNSARLWNAADGSFKLALLGHDSSVTAASFNADGAQILTVSEDGGARLWETRNGQLLFTLEKDAERNILSAGWSSAGMEIITVNSNGAVQVWNTLTGQPVRSLKVPPALRVSQVGFTPTGEPFVAGCLTQAGYAPLTLGAAANGGKTAEVVGLTTDMAGNVWLATAHDGVYFVYGSLPPENAGWERKDVDNVRAIYADRAGNVWLVVGQSLIRYNDYHFIPTESVILSDTLSGNVDDPVPMLDDSQGRLWVGTAAGGYLTKDQTWAPLNQQPGWPTGKRVEVFFEDSQGGLWAGTSTGAWRFDGSRWTQLVPEVEVTTATEGPAGALWFGTRQGLIRYDLAAPLGKWVTFDSNNSGLTTDEVQDLQVDADGNLWVSTFSLGETPNAYPGLPALYLGGALWGWLFLYISLGQARIPEIRARRLSQKIIAKPETLYPLTYALLAEYPDAPGVLDCCLTERLARAGDQAGAQAAAALAALATSSDVETTLARSAAALRADSARPQAQSLASLHGLLGRAAAAKRIPEIAGLELAVNPATEAGGTALHARSEAVEALPAFLPKGTPEAWRALERVGVSLRKYQDVDTASDRLSYLAEALTEVEKAQTAARAVGRPEGAALAAIVKYWRTAITNEINLISGRAELRLELRTRQARRAEQVTVALRLQNTGRATAENIAVTLEPGPGYTLNGGGQFTLERLASGRSTPVEFSLLPAEAETIRLVCRVSWDDRIARDNTLNFADIVRFYEVAQEFQRILNPYIVGHPVKSPEMFRGREDTFQFIAENLSGPIQDRTLVLHGQRRTGKTSILYQLLRGRLGPNFIPVLIDMQEVALLINDSADFLSEIAYQLVRAGRKAGLAIEDPTAEVFAASPTRAFNRFLDKLEDELGERRVVVMFDEFELIEAKIAESKLPADLLGYFRSLVQHRDHVIFLFTGTHRLEEMSHDYWSILFNIALYRRVSFLSPADAARLIREPVAGALDVDELAVEKIIALTSGHPYFIQLICWALVNHCNARERNYATINDVNDAMQEILTTGEAHFAYIWQQANNFERLVLAGVAHTLRPGRDWARPAEILETLKAGGGRIEQAMLVDVLDRLVRQDVLEVAHDGALRYRYQLEVLRLWVEATKSVMALAERRG